MVYDSASQHWFAGGGIYLRWCPNPAVEGVTGYKIYRSATSGGPYTLIATLGSQSPDTTLTDCMSSSRRCGIQSGATGGPPAVNDPISSPCTIGASGTCKIVDLGVLYPTTTLSPTLQLQNTYYYVVTAVRGTQESAYSVENVGWPNYCFAGTCICSGTTCSGTYKERYDPDNLGDIACDDETSELAIPKDSQTNVAEVKVAPMAPYRSIGGMTGSGGGVGGGVSPSASPRWLFFHADHLGSPRVVTDSSGTYVTVHHYMPFGDEKPIAVRVSSANNAFTGHERDIESASTDNPDGLDYMLARYFSSSLGRFVSADPGRIGKQHLVKPQKWNKYAYVLNNPLAYFDPNGEAEVKVSYDVFIAQPRMCLFDGDNRSFSSDMNASARVRVNATIETDPTKNRGNPLLGKQVTVGETRLMGVPIGQATGPEYPSVTASQAKNGDVTLQVNMNMRDPLQPGGQGAFSQVSITINQAASSAEVAGTISGSPSFEANFSVDGGPNTNVPLQTEPTTCIPFVQQLGQRQEIDRRVELSQKK